MVSMELVVLGDIQLGIWVAILLWPSNCVSHCLHDCYTLDELYIEVVFGNLGLVSLGNWAFIRPHGWPVEWMEIVVSKSMMCRDGVGLSRE